MSEATPNNYAPLGPAALYALIHGQPAPPMLEPVAQPARQHDEDSFERRPNALHSPRRRPPDCSVDLERLHHWRDLVSAAHAIDPSKSKREIERAQPLQDAYSPEDLQIQRRELRTRLRHHLDRCRDTPHHPSPRLTKLKHCVRDLRINLRACNWPNRYLPARTSQYDARDLSLWLEQIKAWDAAITR